MNFLFYLCLHLSCMAMEIELIFFSPAYLFFFTQVPTQKLQSLSWLVDKSSDIGKDFFLLPAQYSCCSAYPPAAQRRTWQPATWRGTWKMLPGEEEKPPAHSLKPGTHVTRFFNFFFLFLPSHPRAPLASLSFFPFFFFNHLGAGFSIYYFLYPSVGPTCNFFGKISKQGSIFSQISNQDKKKKKKKKTNCI